MLLVPVVCSTTGVAALAAAVRSFLELKDSTVAAVESTEAAHSCHGARYGGQEMEWVCVCVYQQPN